MNERRFLGTEREIPSPEVAEKRVPFGPDVSLSFPPPLPARSLPHTDGSDNISIHSDTIYSGIPGF